MLDFRFFRGCLRYKIDNVWLFKQLCFRQFEQVVISLKFYEFFSDGVVLIGLYILYCVSVFFF